MMKVKILAPAKINLHLDVGNIRPDGFHNICSLFQAVSVFDEIQLSIVDSEGVILINGDFNCLPQENLIYKAIVLFRKDCQDFRGIEVSVKKRIPTEAGLGGGSSDAAAVLKSLVLLLDYNPGEARLFEMALALGSDVPFFLKYPSAAVTGRGEILEKIKDVPRYYGVILKPAGDGVSTGSAYAAVDRMKREGLLNQKTLSKDVLIDHFLNTDPSQWPFFNSFLETYRKDNKPLEFIQKLLYDAGAIFTGLSGSGSSFFGIFLSQELAVDAGRSLSGQFPVVESFYFLNGFPEVLVI